MTEALLPILGYMALLIVGCVVIVDALLDLSVHARIAYRRWRRRA